MFEIASFGGHVGRTSNTVGKSGNPISLVNQIGLKLFILITEQIAKIPGNNGLGIFRSKWAVNLERGIDTIVFEPLSTNSRGTAGETEGKLERPIVRRIVNLLVNVSADVSDSRSVSIGNLMETKFPGIGDKATMEAVRANPKQGNRVVHEKNQMIVRTLSSLTVFTATKVFKRAKSSFFDVVSKTLQKVLEILFNKSIGEALIRIGECNKIIKFM